MSQIFSEIFKQTDWTALGNFLYKWKSVCQLEEFLSSSILKLCTEHPAKIRKPKARVVSKMVKDYTPTKTKHFCIIRVLKAQNHVSLCQHGVCRMSRLFS